MAPTTDYDTMSRAELTKLRADLDRAISTASERDKRAALKDAEDAARQHGFALADLADLIGKGGSGRGSGARRGKSDLPARFRNPDNPDQASSGRGRRPGWYSDALAAGRPVEDLKVG